MVPVRIFIDNYITESLVELVYKDVEQRVELKNFTAVFLEVIYTAGKAYAQQPPQMQHVPDLNSAAKPSRSGWNQCVGVSHLPSQPWSRVDESQESEGRVP